MTDRRDASVVSQHQTTDAVVGCDVR
jgi:hypothetical protein